MGLLTMNSEQLRYKMKHLNELCPNRSVANDNELFDIYEQFRDLIEQLDYKVDIVDLYTMLHCAMEDFDMYE